MDMIWLVGALVALAVAAMAFGVDSRDGLRGDESARWQSWRASAADRRGRLAGTLGGPLEAEASLRRADFEHDAATQRLVGPSIRLPRPSLPSVRPAAYALGSTLLRCGLWLQRLAAPGEPAVGGPV